MTSAPVPYVTAKAAMTLKSDTTPITIKVNKPRGTIYWGGAGLDGPYISDQVAAFQTVGIQHVVRGTRTYTMPVDSIRSGLSVRYRDSPIDEDWHIHGMEYNSAPQFNMIGYSYGSLVAAQTAQFYAHNGHIVDHLILVGSPIDREFLELLKKQENIRKIVVKNLREHGDPIYAGISQIPLLLSVPCLYRQLKKTKDTGEGTGHFYYASTSADGARRRLDLAKFIYGHGLR
ncbi:alpha/beta fold hydrolase [Telluria aromaticivorans]|uniref:Alpha/beta hydrolase n=1 Tax=Telluria aromaticivorans TaxID=2725995 RepID=A0A7Y2K0W3_9BURK|nr:alpha/beta fold hydrolase [Telluria aromaticivorans]NNG24516.1 alpha/beta hydrolase [Telluria aromaticivorans]